LTCGVWAACWRRSCCTCIRRLPTAWPASTAGCSFAPTFRRWCCCARTLS
jgi:hypothetical protein